MLTARSPIRSKSLLIFNTEMINRRSIAIGLMQRQDLQTLLFHFDLEPIDFRIALPNLEGQLLVTLDNRSNRQMDLLVDQRAEGKQLVV